MIFFAFLLFPVILPQGYACECFGTKDYTPIVDDSELVFIGTVNNIVVNGEHPTVFVTFDVHSIAKGELTKNQVTTSTPLSDCSVDYKIDTTYVVIIYEKESLSTDRCSTKPLEIMGYYEVIPDSLLSAMAEPEVPDVQKYVKPSINDEFIDEQICGFDAALVDGICQVTITDNVSIFSNKGFMTFLITLVIVIPVSIGLVVYWRKRKPEFKPSTVC